MRRKTAFTVLLTILVSFVILCPIKAEENDDLSLKQDAQAPVITIKNHEDMITIVQDGDFSLQNYVAISDNSNEFRMVTYGKVDTAKCGIYKLILLAVDAAGNTTQKELTIKVISQSKMDELITAQKAEMERIAYAERQAAIARQEAQEAALKSQEDFLQNAPSASSAYDFALAYVGMGGQCTDVAQAFIDGWFGGGYNVFDTYTIDASQAQPGDIIYYANSGIGTVHYAVYLGGDSALHGNFNGSTVIRSIYLKNGSAPEFRRLSGR